jgi:hypothetical protein
MIHIQPVSFNGGLPVMLTDDIFSTLLTEDKYKSLNTASHHISQLSSEQELLYRYSDQRISF